MMNNNKQRSNLTIWKEIRGRCGASYLNDVADKVRQLLVELNLFLVLLNLLLDRLQLQVRPLQLVLSATKNKTNPTNQTQALTPDEDSEPPGQTAGDPI